MRRTVIAALSVVAAAASGTAAQAQQLGVYRTFATSALPEFTRTDGMGAFMLLPMPGLSARGSVYMHTSGYDTRVRSCKSVGFPPSGCIEEDAHRRTQLRGFAATAVLPMLKSRRLTLDLDAGVSFTLLTAEDEVASGRPTTLWTTQTGNVGVPLAATAQLRPVPRVPLVLFASAGNHYIRFTACGEYAHMDAPFCGGHSLRELRLGLGYEISR